MSVVRKSVGVAISLKRFQRLTRRHKPCLVAFVIDLFDQVPNHFKVRPAEEDGVLAAPRVGMNNQDWYVDVMVQGTTVLSASTGLVQLVNYIFRIM